MRHRTDTNPAKLHAGDGEVRACAENGTIHPKKPSMRITARTTIVLALLAVAATATYAQDAAERKFIRAGMDEAEVLVKLGKPDHESQVSGNGAAVRVVRWSYLPHARDAQTLTIITLRGGRVYQVERKISR